MVGVLYTIVESKDGNDFYSMMEVGFKHWWNGIGILHRSAQEDWILQHPIGEKKQS
jgi:hypothetical protein